MSYPRVGEWRDGRLARPAGEDARRSIYCAMRSCGRGGAGLP